MSKKSDMLAKGFDLPKVEPNTSIDENTARKFETEAPPQKTKKSRRTPTLRRDNKGERLAVYIPEDIASELRVMCAKERRSLSDAVTAALDMWLKKQSPKSL